MGQGGPVTTGGARANLTVDVSQLQAARAAVQSFATGVNTTLTGMNPAINRSQASLSGLAGSVRGLAGAFGVTLGVQAVFQLGRAALASEAAATAYDRQSVAANNLAGSQGRLTALMQVYEKATGGIVDKASALSNVTKLMAVGFADDAQELEKFATAIRGISVAMGMTQDTVTQNLILELFTQRGMRLDQLGLEYSKVKARADELAAADSSLTAQMAYQNAVLEQAIQRFGGLATSAEGAATGLELTATAWKNLNLEIGQVAQGPLSALGAGLALFIDIQTARLKAWVAELDVYIKLLRQMGMAGPWLTTGERDFVTSAGARTAQRRNRGSNDVLPPIDTEAVREVKLDWARGVNEVNAKLHDDIIDAEADYGRQRTDAIRTYQKGVLREERDFQRGRLRAELEHLDSIADVYKEQARRESKAAADLARTQGQARADADERIADMRGDSAKRLVELEKDYAEDRERAAEDHRDKLLSAAGRLDAIALLEERKRWLRESEDAKDAHDEQRADLQDQLAERIADEEKNLEKSNRLQNEAAQRQLAEARANDALRIEEMKADFAKRKAEEDADRAIRNADRAQDHADQLAEMARAHILRLQQIADQAREERVALQEAADAELVRLKAADEATKKRQEAKEKALEELWDKFHDHIKDSLGGTAGGGIGGRSTVPGMAVPGAFATGGLVQRSGWAQVHRGEFVMPAPAMGMAAGMNNSRSISIAQGAITVYGAPGQDIEALADVIDERLIKLLESV